MTLLFAMGILVVTWFLIAAALTGLGLGLARILTLRPAPDRCILPCFWLGFAATLACLQIWHIAFPLNFVPAFIVAAAGAAGLISNRKLLLESLAAARSDGAIVPAIVLVVWLANRCIGPARAFDTGYYDFAVVKWTTSYPIVPGLANLHDRLGFNNSSLLYAAMLDHGFWRNRSPHLANGLLLCALMMQIVYSGLRLLRPNTATPAAGLFDVALFIPATYLGVEEQYLNIASLTTDVPVIVVLLAAASMLFGQLIRQGSDEASDAFERFVIATLLTAAITIKLSSLLFAFTAGLLLVFLWYRKRRTPSSRPVLSASASVAAALLALIPFVIRGVILTGYPLYPSTFGATGFDWLVPRSACLLQQKYILAYGRFYYNYSVIGTSFENVPWFRAWLLHLPRFAKMEVVLPAILVCASLLVWFVHRLQTEDRLPRAWTLSLPCIASLIFWIYKAPTPRFGFFALWILAATWISLSALPYVATLRARKCFLALVCVVAAATIAIRVVGKLQTEGKQEALALLLNGPGPDHGFQPFPKASFRSFTTDSGLILLVPVEDGRGYDAPLLTTPWPERKLQLRKKGDPASGFRAIARTNGITG